MVVTQRNRPFYDQQRTIMKIIDPHLHLFDIEQGDYYWLKPESSPCWPDKNLIHKTFTELDLSLTSPFELAGFVHIEAGFDNNEPWRELAALEQSCNKPFSAVANIDLTLSCEDFTRSLAILAKYQSFVGVRHILDEQALSLLTNTQVLSNFKRLNNFIKESKQGLVFETQLSLCDITDVRALCNVISDNQDITFIINHAGFPPLDTDTANWQHWKENLRLLSKHPLVAIKCSGWEMTDRHYQVTWLNKMLTVIFNIFGHERTLLASNFPLCLLSKSSYHSYWAFMLSCEFFQALTAQEKSALCYDNALRWYSIKL
jgi:predicted TIM-barrel fold metal-dependent hydrolase